MRTVSRLTIILLLVPFVLGADVARAYRLAEIAGELHGSAAAVYASFCPEGSTSPAIAPRADQNMQPGLNQKKIPAIHALAHSAILRPEFALSRTHDGLPLCIVQTPLQSHTLVLLCCLLTV